VEVTLGASQVSLETGSVARQAHGSVVVRSGGTFLLAAVVAGQEGPGDARGTPLTVDYRERTSAAGRIPGGYLRREQRMSDREILVSRLVDRTLRPLLGPGHQAPTQVWVTVFGYDPGTDLDTLAILAASGALHLSDVPFRGPVAGVRACRVGERYLAFPTPTTQAEADLDVVVCGTRTGVTMVEGRGRFASDVAVLRAVDTATDALPLLLDALDGLRHQAGRPKRPPTPPPDLSAMVAEVDTLVGTDVDAALKLTSKTARQHALATAQAGALSVLASPAAGAAFDAVVRDRARAAILDGRRVGGRAPDDVRPISAEVGLLGSNHGSALFRRGDTQALVSATLGTGGDALRTEGLAGTDLQRFILHYNFPPWSVGELGPSHGPGRREVGHGALAHRALEPALPPDGELPYTVRVVSDVTDSDGSSSMATVCGASLALMDAGVGLVTPVAGIAMGLVRQGDRVAILTDICGDEDHWGDMDLKVAGSADGISALQLDNAGANLQRADLEQALAQARAARRHVLEAMGAVLAAPRREVATHAPRAVEIQVDPGRVGAIIGKGGAAIKELQRATGTRIDIKDDGRVTVVGPDQAALDGALARLREVSQDLKEGGVYDATVEEVRDYGAFVRLGDHRALVHVSEWEDPPPKSLEGKAHKGQATRVQVVGVNNRGQLVLSRRAALAAAP
jgi:polyribonucleotide nucleotidyltransferase